MTADQPIRTRWTVLEVQRLSTGEWRVTQEGAQSEGRGESAAEAAAAYCRRVAERADEAGIEV